MITQNRILWLPNGVEDRHVAWDDMSPSSVRNPSGLRIDSETALQSTVVLACARVLAESIASLPLHLYQYLAEGGKAPAREHPLYRRLHIAPNSWQTSFEWREQQVLWLCLWGNSYNLLVPGSAGFATELHPLHPSRMTPERIENGRIRYKYRDERGREETYTQDQIMHIRWLSDDGINGMIPVELARDAIGLARACEIHGARYFGNGARPGFVLTTDNDMKPEAAATLRDNWERMHRGADRASRTAVLFGGLKPMELAGSNNQESQFLETRRFQIEEICRLYRVPPHLVGDLSRSSFSNIEQQSIDFVQHSLLPWLRRFENAFARDLIVEDEKFFAEFDTRGLLRGDAAARASYYSSLYNLGVASINEIRSWESLNPVEGGDLRFVQLNMQTLTQANAAAAAPPEADKPEEQPAAEQPTADVASIIALVDQIGKGAITPEAAKAVFESVFPQMPAVIADSIIEGAIKTPEEPPATEPAPAEPTQPEPVPAGRSLWQGSLRDAEGRSLTISIDFDRTFAADPELLGDFAAKAKADGNSVVMITRRADTPEDRDFIEQTLGSYADAFDAVILAGPEMQKEAAAKQAGISVDIWIDDSPQTIKEIRGFCPTGPGGGIDNSCSSKDGGGGSEGAFGSKASPENLAGLADREGEVGEIHVKVYRVGSVADAPRGIHFGDSVESVSEYKAIHPGQEIQEYVVSAKNAYVTKNQWTAAKALGFDYEEELGKAIKKVNGKNPGPWKPGDEHRIVEAKIKREAKKKGWDAIVYKSPPLPAKHEIVVFSEKTFSQRSLESRGFCPTGSGGGIDNSCGKEGGGKANVLSATEKEAARAALSDRFGGMKDVPSDKLFPASAGGVAGAVLTEPKKKDTVIREVDLSNVRAAQDSVPYAGLDSYIGDPPKDLPIVVEVHEYKYDYDKGKSVPTGETYMTVQAGHTRLGAQILAGRGTAVVRFARYNKHRVPVSEKDPSGYVRPEPRNSRGFCPTGPGGGIDNSCSSKDGGGANYAVGDSMKRSDVSVGQTISIQKHGQKTVHNGVVVSVSHDGKQSTITLRDASGKETTVTIRDLAKIREANLGDKTKLADEKAKSEAKGRKAGAPPEKPTSSGWKDVERYSTEVQEYCQELGVEVIESRSMGSGRNRPTIETLHEIATGVQKLAEAGSPLPERIVITNKRPSGGPMRNAMGYYYPGLSGRESSTIFVSGKVPSGEPDSSIRDGWLAGKDGSGVGGIVIHETGHMLHHRAIGEAFNRLERPGPNTFSVDNYEIAAKVSRYAATCPAEFVAETFAGHTSGIKYDKDVYDLYDKYGGYPLPGRKGKRK